jgi:hypothetical protein
MQRYELTTADCYSFSQPNAKPAVVRCFVKVQSLSL